MRHLTRRTFLEGLGLGSAAVALAACGTAEPSSSPSSAPSATGTASPSPIEASSPPASSSAPPSTSPSEEPSASPPVSLRQRIAGLLIVGFRGLTIRDSDPIAKAIRDDGLGGVILFDRDQLTGGARNVQSRSQVKALIADLRALARDRHLTVSIDQEGGIVTRLSPAHGFPAVASEASIGATGDLTKAKTWADALVATLVDVGVDLNFAPVVDVNVNPKNPAIGALGRSFSADPETVARFAAVEIEAHRRAGVLTTLKHFPGLGSATANTDFGVADVTATWTRQELIPYQRLLADNLVDIVMAGHVVNGQLDRSAPASLSHATVTGLLRDQLGWQGAVVTDDLQAAAISTAFGADDAIELALAAGNDLLLFANQQVYVADLVPRVLDVIEGLVAKGRLTEARIDASVARVAALRGS